MRNTSENSKLIPHCRLCTILGAIAILTMIAGCCCGAQSSDRITGATGNASPGDEKKKRNDRWGVDDLHCREYAKIVIRPQVPVGKHQEKVEVRLSENKDMYEQCMEKAGWKEPTYQLNLDRQIEDKSTPKQADKEYQR